MKYIKRINECDRCGLKRFDRMYDNLMGRVYLICKNCGYREALEES
jgi:hypothetical protein